MQMTTHPIRFEKMNKLSSLLLIALTLMASSAELSAQRRLNRRIAAAQEAFNSHQFHEALERFKRVHSRARGTEQKNSILFKMAECYRMINDTRRAEGLYRRLVRADFEKTEPLVLRHFGDMLRSNQKFSEAETIYKRYLEIVPDDPLAITGLESSKNARDWIANPTKYEVINLRDINSREDDFAPAYADRNFSSLIFSSNREGVTGKGRDDWTNLPHTDLFFTRSDPRGGWGDPILIDADEIVNTGSHEGVAVFAERFSALYFTRCYSQTTEETRGFGCQVYMSRRDGAGWSEAQKIMLGGDSTNVCGHPTLSPDERTIIFVADFEGGQGGRDLWMATRTSSGGAFDTPRNLGIVINTPGDELYPFLRNDTVLYFASDGHIGLGGLDIYRSELKNGQWQQPVNMQFPVNSPADDFGISFHPEGEQGVFTSNRRGGRGRDDIYSFYKAPLIFTLKGNVSDDATLLFMPDIQVVLKGSDGSRATTKTDARGFYSFAPSQIKPNIEYNITIDQPQYFLNTTQFSTVELLTNKDFVKDIALLPIPVKPIPLPEIRYEVGRWELQPKYQDSLQGLIVILEQNPTIVIELAAHTDSRNTYEFNDILSQKRAESVVNYLIERGIASGRLVAKGYGERVPRSIENNITINGFQFTSGVTLNEDFVQSLPTTEQREAAHQLNRRTEFRILSRDFVHQPHLQTTAPSVRLVLNPDENIVTYRSGGRGEIYIPSILNGFNLIFTLNQTDRNTAAISLEQALRLMRDGAVNRNDFEGDATRILAGGTIADRAVLNVRELSIGNRTLSNIKVTVLHRQTDPLMIGENVLRQAGEFTIDKEKRQIVFR